jgi:hypothetical protein
MITVGGVDLATLGFVARSRGPLPMSGRSQTVVSVPGGTPVRTGEQLQPATLRVDGMITAASHSALLTARDQLIAALTGERTIRFSDFADREWVGRLDSASDLSILDPQWVALAANLSLTWSVPDPRARAIDETTRTGSGALVLGTAPSEIRVSVNDVSGATIRVRAGGSSGTILRELVWSGNEGALVVDADGERVTLDGDNAIDGITAASRFPVADPAEGADYIQVPAGATVTYRARWW